LAIWEKETKFIEEFDLLGSKLLKEIVLGELKQPKKHIIGKDWELIKRINFWRQQNF